MNEVGRELSMGVGDGGEGFGFAPRGGPVRRKIEHKARPVPNAPPQPPPPKAPYPPVLSGDHVPLSRRPPWVWLLIGVLLGSGGTLLATSVWLQQSGERRVVETALGGDDRDKLASGDQLENGNSLKNGEAPAASVLGSTVVEEELGEGAAATTMVAALAVDEVDAGPVIDRQDEPPINPVPDSVSTEKPEREPQSDAFPRSSRPAPLAELDRQGASVTPPAKAATSIREASPSFASSSQSSEEALAALSQDFEDEASDGDQVSVEERTDVEPTAGSQRAELPPRIKQALEIANGNRESSPRLINDGGRLYRVQLAAFFSEAAARTYWREANQRLPGVFTDVEPIFDQRTEDERLYLRIWVGAFDSRVEADGYCGWLREQGQDCFVTRVDNL